MFWCDVSDVGVHFHHLVFDVCLRHPRCFVFGDARDRLEAFFKALYCVLLPDV